MKTYSSVRLAPPAPVPSLLVLRLASLAMLVLILLPAAAHAQGGVPLWTNRYSGPAKGNDIPFAVAVDSSGNVFVTGSSSDSAGANSDYATVAYSNAGVPLWTNRYNGGVIGGATAIAVDSSGNVFVTGGSWNGTDYDYATIKYSGAGVPLWTNSNLFGGSAIAVDSIGNVIVTGTDWTDSRGDYRTIAVSNSGVPLWTNVYDENSGDRPHAIAVDSSGNVFVTGISRGRDSPDYATIAYSNSGMPLWTNRYNGPANLYDLASAIAVDSRGNVFVTGGSFTANGTDYATIAYSNSGVPLWTNRYNGPANGDDTAQAIAVDSSGNVFVTGRSWNGSNYDYVTLAYSNAGVPLYTNRYNGPGNGEDWPSAIAVDTRGNVFVTGHSWIGTNLDYVTIKYSSSVPPPRLDFQLLNNELVPSCTNTGFSLPSAPATTGTFTNLPAATSPYTNALSGPQQFFRLRGD